MWRAEESIPIITMNMEREISPFRDLISLIRLWSMLRNLRPAICNAGTPKAGFWSAWRHG